MKGIRSSNNVVRIPIMSILYHTFGPTRAPRGCNMAFWRNDLIRVNGYDEDFKGWGFEDAELCIRLNNSEIHQRCMKFRGVAFHLHHNQAERSGCNSNEQRYKDSIRCHRTRCEKGLDRHLTPKISYEIGRGSAIVIGGYPVAANSPRATFRTMTFRGNGCRETSGPGYGLRRSYARRRSGRTTTDHISP